MLSKLLGILLIFLTSVNNCYAGSTDVVELQPDQLAPFHGLLFTIEKASEMKGQLLERDLYKELSNSQQHSIDLLKVNSDLSEKKVNILLEQNDKIAENLRSAQGMTNLERFAFFALGVLATVGAGLTIKNITK